MSSPNNAEEFFQKLATTVAFVKGVHDDYECCWDFPLRDGILPRLDQKLIDLDAKTSIDKL